MIIKNLIYSTIIGTIIGFANLVFLIYFDISWRAGVCSLTAGFFTFLFYLYFESLTTKERKR